MHFRESYKITNMRLNKYLSESGVCSRRAADKAIEYGLVTVNGKKAVMGMQVENTDEIIYMGKKVSHNEKPVFIAFNKPVGVECTADKSVQNNIIDYINYPQRIYYAGRLDKDSHGLILLSNQGDITNEMMRAANYHEKEYIVKVDKPIDEDFIESMMDGVYLKELEITTRECQVMRLGTYTFSIILTTGLNRQIRRMCETLGYKVVDLKRVRVMNVALGDLKEGTYRDLTEDEIRLIKKQLGM